MFQFKEFNRSAGVSANILLAILIGLLYSDYAYSLDNELCVGPDCPERSGNGLTGSMWFGPRLGRRRRSGGDTTKNDDVDINTITDAVNAGPWTLVAYHGSGDKRHSTQFTPRLGRELSDNLLARYVELAQDWVKSSPIIEENSVDVEPHRQLSLPPPPPPQFAPRLGRHLTVIPSPRFGHRLRILKTFTI